MEKEQLLAILRLYLLDATLLQENLLANNIVFNLFDAFEYFITEVNNSFPNNTIFYFRYDLHFYNINNILTINPNLYQDITTTLVALWKNLYASQNREVNYDFLSSLNMQLNQILNFHIVNTISNNNDVSNIVTDDEESIYSEEESEDEGNEGEVNIVGYENDYGVGDQPTNFTNADEDLSGANVSQQYHAWPHS